MQSKGVMKRCWLVCLLFVFYSAGAQDIQQKLLEQVKTLVADSQMRAGTLALYVADVKTGAEIFNWNGSVGLAPASTQKIITSVAALELLGKNYRYTTQFGYRGALKGDKLKGDLIIKGSGDPTFGSWRYDATKPDSVFKGFNERLAKLGLKKITGDLYIDGGKFSFQPTPGGWIWDDIGNYYGAGTWGLNWRENQFDLLLKPGMNEGDPVEITGTRPGLQVRNFVNLLKTGKKGSGDNGYIYLPPYAVTGFVEGTVPAESSFTLTGAIPDGPLQFGTEIQKLLDSNKIKLEGKMLTSEKQIVDKDTLPAIETIIYTHTSPAMDSIIYWFMKRSINLYGEALMKTIAAEKTGVGSTDSGVAYVRRFYNEKGFDPATLKIIDGSGLSPSNRITAAFLGKILMYAKKQDWFDAFAASFPRFNNMMLKSGSIRGVKSFAGYHTAADGNEYVVVIIVNNFDGTAGAIEKKMFKVLDVLK